MSTDVDFIVEGVLGLLDDDQIDPELAVRGLAGAIIQLSEREGRLRLKLLDDAIALLDEAAL